MKNKSILIISDIEGSSCCWSYRASSFMTKEWRQACIGMTRDVNQVVKGLFDAGDIHELYSKLIRLCYLTPLMEKTISLALFLYHLWGRIGLGWVRQGIWQETSQ